MSLNESAARLVERLLGDAQRLGVTAATASCGTRLVDCTSGGLEAGLRLAEICLSGLGDVRLAPPVHDTPRLPAVQVATDQPLAACMASQYAGWAIKGDKYFAMGSGPMRAAAGKEDLFAKIGHREQPPVAVGVLETRRVPPEEVCLKIAAAAGVEPAKLTLLFAPTGSLAGTVQVVARSVETALHKLLELGFDLRRVRSGFGVAPLPPPARDDLQALGRTNDAILYGAEVTLWVTGDDASLADLVPQVPSSASHEHGDPFEKIFTRHGGDFYQIDPHLFSPAVVVLHNLDTGRTHRAGRLAAKVLERSFFG